MPKSKNAQRVNELIGGQIDEMHAPAYEIADALNKDIIATRTPDQKWGRIKSHPLLYKDGPRAGKLTDEFVSYLAQKKYEELIDKGVGEKEALAVSFAGARRFRALYRLSNTLNVVGPWEGGGYSTGVRARHLRDYQAGPMYKEAFSPTVKNEAEAAMGVNAGIQARKEYYDRQSDRELDLVKGTSRGNTPLTVEQITNPLGAGYIDTDPQIPIEERDTGLDADAVVNLYKQMIRERRK